ncbi:hypothetical protein RIF29_34403 [Crotalaria pallida]|uniref:Beta-galactosidase n=1 Tax=Crotalaria pallida TaxID=3830 RepID=A0AAN9E9C7_CROPI
MNSYSWIRILLLGLALLRSCSSVEVTYDSNALIINGQRRIIFSGAVHYPRSTVEMWPDIIQKAKDGGLDAIETYIFWNHHEPVQRAYDFSGNLDFIKFLKLIQDVGLFVILRIGPYVCAEWNYGGFPLWLHNIPGIVLRTDNPIYKNEMQVFTTKIVNMAKEAKLFASQGGPIIFAQIENEYGNVMGDFKDPVKTSAYIKWCAQMAVAQNIGVPWIMCQQSDAPQPMINTCNGHYCHQFKPNNPKSPKIFSENWIGWFQKWGEKAPHRTAEDSAFSVARFFQTGGILNNYYMYHGGTNFGRTSGGPYITTSYDYDAPLDEYGNLNQPKWGHLKQLHAAIKLGEKILTNGTRIDKDFGNGDGKYFVPAWSVTILDGCNKEVFNTAKVNTQTLILVKKSDDGTTNLNWSWKPEPIKDTLKGEGKFKAPQLLEQKDLTLDASDYLWYMTTVAINDTTTWNNATLRVGTMGHTLHGYGYGFDMKKTGIAGGPVQLVGKNNETIDLSNNLWSYKVGLNGEKKRLYDLQPRIGISWVNGASKTYPVERPMTWYKADFNSPFGTNPVVVDMQGMGKGHAWVNGHSIGRYRPSFISSADGCSDTCDY